MAYHSRIASLLSMGRKADLTTIRSQHYKVKCHEIQSISKLDGKTLSRL